jgi:hypothetical protein
MSRKIKVGDRVEIVKCAVHRDNQDAGYKGVIEAVYDPPINAYNGEKFKYEVRTDERLPDGGISCCAAEVKLIDDKLNEGSHEYIASDPINPSHYQRGGIQAIDVIEAYELNFRAANVLKYVLRYKYKGKPLEDLKKAKWYLDREIEHLEKEAK